MGPTEHSMPQPPELFPGVANSLLLGARPGPICSAVVAGAGPTPDAPPLPPVFYNHWYGFGNDCTLEELRAAGHPLRLTVPDLEGTRWLRYRRV